MEGFSNSVAAAALAMLLAVSCPEDSHASCLADGEKPSVEFSSVTLDLGGQIEEAGGPVHGYLVWRNTGDSPVSISGVSSSCGCLSAGFLAREVAPGERDSIMVTYHPKGHPGRFSHKVFVYAGDTAPSAVLEVIGTVKAASVPVWRYPVQMGFLYLKQKEVFMDGGKRQVEIVECLNSGDKPFTLDVEGSLVPPCITLSMEPATVQPGETADIVIAYCPDAGTAPSASGKVQDRLPVILGGLGIPPSQCTIYVLIGQKPEICTEPLVENK